MKVKKWLDKVAHMESMKIGGSFSEVWCSNFDGSYMGHVGQEENMEFLADREITEELEHGVGFSPKDGKWYGWSHRAIFGFEIGSECKKGQCHYNASCIEDEIEAAIRFWTDEYVEDISAKIESEGVIRLTYTYSQTTPNTSLRGKTGTQGWNYNPEFGRGEWTAKTMEDAKQMAVDFNEGVS